MPNDEQTLSADTVASIMSAQLSDAVHSAALAATDAAHAAGMAESKCEQIFDAAVQAAARSLEEITERDDGSGTGTLSRQFSRETARIEGTLARAIKKNAIRVVDLFQDWDEDRDGAISKKEFRQGLANTGIGATSDEIDALFNRWDKDGSGSIDYNELNKALRKRMANLRNELERDETSVDAINLLGSKHRAEVKQAKEWKEAAKERRTALSPRSQQLKEA